MASRFMWTVSGVVLGAGLAFAPNVLSESEPTQEFIAPEETKASGTIQTPTPVIEAENYHPMVSFAPLVEALEPAVVAIEVEATQAGMERNPLLEQFLGCHQRHSDPKPCREKAAASSLVRADCY